MPQSAVQDELSLTCFTKDFKHYGFRSLLSDLVAGLSVSMLALPQSLAYALAAGLPAVTGLYATVFSAFITAFFGSSRHLIMGTSNAITILIQGGLSTILYTYYRDIPPAEQEIISLQILTQLMFLVGFIQICAAFLKLGRLIHFVSHTVIVAYVSGVAIALIVNQLYPLFGVSVPINMSSLYERIVYFFSHINLIHNPTAMIGIFCLLLLLVLRKTGRKTPYGAIMLSVIALIAYSGIQLDHYFLEHNMEFAYWNEIKQMTSNIAVVGNMGDHEFLPKLSLPFFHTGIMNNLLPVAFAIALLSVIEATTTAKSLAASSGQQFSTNQEIFSLGIGNFFSAFIGALPISGSNSRSSLNFENGGKTRASALFSCVFVYLIVFSFGIFIEQIPQAAFAALLIMSAFSIVNFKQLFLCLKATRSDALVLILSLLSCFFFNLDVAFYIGVAMSITLYLKKAAIPQLVEFTVDANGMLHSIDEKNQIEKRQIRFIKVEGELFFGSADIFQSTLKSITEDDTTTKVIVLQLKNARDIDATTCLALQQLHSYLKSSGRHLIACGITYQIWDVLSDSGLVEIINKNNLFIFDERHPHLSVQRALQRAYKLLNKETSLEVSCSSEEIQMERPILVPVES